MAFIDVFKRCEYKYILTQDEYLKLKEAMKNHMETESDYGVYSIFNLYFDTPTYSLIQHSISKPVYKEKLRLRSYGKVDDDGLVFLELKKKFEGVVYKRRIKLSKKEAMDYLVDGKPLSVTNQISKELDYFIHRFSDLKPKVFLSYDREAYQGKEDRNFRMTFDRNISYRDTNLDLSSNDDAVKIMDDSMLLMEIKTVGSIPFWLVNFLSEHKIYKKSFSKYGTVYLKYLLPKMIKNKKDGK